MKDYVFNRLNKNNLADLARLYSKVYNRNIRVEYYHKKYETKYTGVENAGFISYNDNQPVASFGVIPCFIQSGDKTIPAGQAVDAMTDPAHRHKGMFMKLSNITYDLCDELGIKLLFGFPNQDSYPAMINHLGWKETGKMSRFTIPVGRNWKQFFLKRKNYGKVPDKYFSEQHEIQNSVVEDGYAGVYRSKTYMSYKSFTDNFVIKMESADLWVKMSNELIIGDIFLKKNNKDFFREIKLLAKELNLEKISFQVCNNCSLHKLFSDHYQPIPSFPVLIKDLGSGLPAEKIKFTFADIDIF